MFFPEDRIRIWLCIQPVDMRRSFDGLSAMVKNHLGEDPLSGQLFVFINRRKTYLKILFFDRTGYCIWAKRLESGQFNFDAIDGVKRSMDWMSLKLLLEGLDPKGFRRYKRYVHPTGNLENIAKH
ncbi:MAG: IS66 family insertion sequence element accessory protein TnpB [Candidatus Poribacteria bacterium]|jgi:transposase|nr:IS66 family insertion sequence element accessory protein TnpB [Candidatus Poribacteria bacterium]|tara:strand:- start:1679 stop:2053 length:375 start_codon:yes stop_codon:yes gene_type:complete